jgi:hypothetical protein
MRAHLFILNEAGEPVGTDDTLAWARWYEVDANRVVAHTDIDGHTYVSTVFTAIDIDPTTLSPMLWETAIFRTDRDYDDGRVTIGSRYASRSDAVTGHAWWCAFARGELTEEIAREFVRERRGKEPT